MRIDLLCVHVDICVGHFFYVALTLKTFYGLIILFMIVRLENAPANRVKIPTLFQLSHEKVATSENQITNTLNNLQQVLLSDIGDYTCVIGSIQVRTYILDCIKVPH